MRRSRSSRPQVDVLESRTLFAATAILSGDQLLIQGTEERDVIVFSLDRDDPEILNLQLTKETFTYDVADLALIRIQTLGGNDSITFREKLGAIYIATDVQGGDGNDTITTGSGNDVIDGGAGNDKLTGGAGDDYLTGADGNDRLLGGDDNDQLEAGAGRDTLQGAAGDDNLDGGDGKDAVKSDAGADRVAADAVNLSEVKGKAAADATTYELTDVETLPAVLTEALAEIGTELPGFNVQRAEVEGEHYSIYYKFSTDPALHKLVIDVIDGELELVTRQVSLTEARPSAIDAFNADFPNNTGLVSIFQMPGSRFDVRYRDENGEVQTARTIDILWGIDDIESDQDNDGRSDHRPDGADDGNDQPQPNEGDSQNPM